jgi:hypothetical protein
MRTRLEIRIKHEGLAWEDTPVAAKVETDIENLGMLAEIIARLHGATTGEEIRWNRKGIFQGHYRVVRGILDEGVIADRILAPPGTHLEVNGQHVLEARLCCDGRDIDMGYMCNMYPGHDGSCYSKNEGLHFSPNDGGKPVCHSCQRDYYLEWFTGNKHRVVDYPYWVCTRCTIKVMNSNQGGWDDPSAVPSLEKAKFIFMGHAIR